jgi:hypothetical protein
LQKIEGDSDKFGQPTVEAKQRALVNSATQKKKLKGMFGLPSTFRYL